MLSREEIVEEGIVESFKNGTAVVRIVKQGTCDGCSAKGFCSSNNDGNIVSALSNSTLEQGDYVRISIPGENITSASTFIYGIPLLLIMGGLFIGHYLFNENVEVYSALFSLVLIVIYCGIVYFTSKKKDYSSLMPRIVFVKKK
jgi:positive regulator of sigma E activity